MLEISFNSYHMNTANKGTATVAGKTKQNNYVTPEITFLELTLEEGFAQSNTTDDWTPDTW